MRAHHNVNFERAARNAHHAAHSDRLFRGVEAIRERLAHRSDEVAVPLFASSGERHAAFHVYVDQRSGRLVAVWAQSSGVKSRCKVQSVWETAIQQKNHATNLQIQIALVKCQIWREIQNFLTFLRMTEWYVLPILFWYYRLHTIDWLLGAYILLS